ncbi:MAG TPA: YoaK family protein [Jatrophihabitantaceae bacterium]
MNDLLSRVSRSLFDDVKHGVLPVLLLGLTMFTGVIDAVSILALNRVFVANMTGNVVFTGFALVGIPGFRLDSSLFALGGFLIGAWLAGTVAPRLHGTRRGLILRVTVTAELVLVAIALLIGIGAGRHAGHLRLDVIAAICAIALGGQNMAARRLAVPDLTTSVLTMTLTGLAADGKAWSNPPVVARRIFAVAAMLLGAIIGAVVSRDQDPQPGLIVATAILAAVVVASWILRPRLARLD